MVYNNDGPIYSMLDAKTYSGVCCIPTCNVNNVFELIYDDGCYYNNELCPPQLPVCEREIGIQPNFQAYRQIVKVPLGSNNGILSGPANIVWNPGYPGALSSYVDVFWLRSVAYSYVGSAITDMNTFCREGSIPPSFTWTSNGFNFTPGDQTVKREYISEKFVLLACTSEGNLIDITDLALNRAAMTLDLKVNPLDGRQWLHYYGFEQTRMTINTLDFEYTAAFLETYGIPTYWTNQDIANESYDLKNYLDNGGLIYNTYQDCVNANNGDCYSPIVDSVQDLYWYDFGIDPDIGRVQRLPFPHEGGYNMTYTCNDTVSQSGCLYGGVLSPQGTALGIWHSNETCLSYNCNS